MDMHFMKKVKNAWWEQLYMEAIIVSFEMVEMPRRGGWIG